MKSNDKNLYQTTYLNQYSHACLILCIQIHMCKEVFSDKGMHKELHSKCQCNPVTTII